MPIAGGRAKPVAQGLAFDTQPVFLPPDGRWIAFVSDRSGRRKSLGHAADGSRPPPDQLCDDDTPLTSPAWSADGKAIFVSRFRADLNGYELWRHDLPAGATGRSRPRERRSVPLRLHQHASALPPRRDGQHFITPPHRLRPISTSFRNGRSAAAIWLRLRKPSCSRNPHHAAAHPPAPSSARSSRPMAAGSLMPPASTARRRSACVIPRPAPASANSPSRPSTIRPDAANWQDIFPRLRLHARRPQPDRRPQRRHRAYPYRTSSGMPIPFTACVDAQLAHSSARTFMRRPAPSARALSGRRTVARRQSYRLLRAWPQSM